MCRGYWGGGSPHFHTRVGWEGRIELFALFIDVEMRGNYGHYSQGVVLLDV